MPTTILIETADNGWTISHKWTCVEGVMDEFTSVFQEEQAEEAIKRIKSLMNIED